MREAIDDGVHYKINDIIKTSFQGEKGSFQKSEYLDVSICDSKNGCIKDNRKWFRLVIHWDREQKALMRAESSTLSES